MVDFGNAITSRMEVSPANNITNRSNPYAMPPTIPHCRTHNCYEGHRSTKFHKSNKPGRSQDTVKGRGEGMQYRVVEHQGLVLLEGTQISLLPDEHVHHIVMLGI